MWALRLADLGRLFNARYGGVLPNDDAGEDDLMVVAHHLYGRPGDLLKHIKNYAFLRAPWLSADGAKAIAEEVQAKPLRWTADTLAWRMRLTDRERAGLGITVIGAIDFNAEQREQRRAAKSRARKAAIRKAAGAKPHSESAAQKKAWTALDISERTWYRRRKAEATVAEIRPQHSCDVGVAESLPPSAPVLDLDLNQIIPPCAPAPACHDNGVAVEMPLIELPTPPELAATAIAVECNEIVSEGAASVEWVMGRDPKTGELFERVGVARWEPPPFDTRAARGYALAGEYDCRSFHLSARQLARLRKQFSYLGDEFEDALILCDAWYTQYPPPPDGKMLHRIKAFLKTAKKHPLYAKRQSRW